MSVFLPALPEPASDNAHLKVTHMPTPPPSPRRSQYWGLLKPLNADAPFKYWYLFREQSTYRVGGPRTDFQVLDVPSLCEAVYLLVASRPCSLVD